MKTLLIILIIALIVYVVWLFIKSKNNFFTQSQDFLEEKRKHLINVLSDFGIDTEKDKRWLQAYDLFRNYTNQYMYDGATIVKDLHTIYGYDAPAGNHDISYIMNDWFSFRGLINKFTLDYKYGLDMRALQIPYTTAWSRVFLLWIATPLWYIFLIFKKITKKK